MGSSLDELDPAIREGAKWLYEVARYNGLNPKVTSARRSSAQQQRLYDQYLRDKAAGRPTFGAAPPGKSKHEQGLAFDLVVSDYRMLKPLGELWESMGGTWGGRFSGKGPYPGMGKDPIHFDYRGKI